jgi:hypothetical protein
VILRGASAALLLLVTLYASNAAAIRLVSSRQRSVRWTAAGLLACWSAICVFHLLAALQQFRILPALIIALAGGISIRWMTGLGVQRVFSLVLDDLIVACRYLQGSGGPGRTLARLALVSLVGTVAVRALILPPLGWDSITYHAVKAAMWVQTGGSLPLELPGLWSDFKYFPPAGEILGAWAMLPFHSDLAYSLVDVALWLGCWSVLHALARQVGVAERLLPYCSLYLLTVPAVHSWIGSGYVDVTMHFFALGGLLFILRWADGRQETVSLSLWILAWSSAVAVKITALPLLLLGGVVILVAMIRRRGADRATLPGLLSGGLAAAMVLLPIFLHNYRHLGFPLSPFPARIAGLTLGRIGPALDWISQSEAWSWDRELVALVRVLGIGAGPNLGPIAVAVLAASLPAAMARLRARPLETSLLIGFAACTAWPYFSKAYAITRVTRYGGNGRFLYGVLVVAALLVAAGIASMGSRRTERAVITLTVAAAVGSALTNLIVNASSLEWPALLIGAIALPLLVTGIARCRSGAVAGTRAAALAGGILLATSLAAPSLQSYRSELRYESLDRSRMGHEILTYWTSMAAMLDDPDRAHKLALSQAPFHYAGSFLYYFMGSRFQNELHFVPPTRDGGTPELSLPEDHLRRQRDFEAWFRRLHQKGITHVVVLTPPWHELDWLQANPQDFIFVLGDPGFYGLWRVRRAASSELSPAAASQACPEEVP